MGIINFIFAFIVAGVVLSGVSLLWPKLTTQQRPAVLTQLRSAVIKTPLGNEMAQVLGVTDETHTEPINVSSAAASVVSSLTATVEQKAQQAVAERVAQQLVKQFDQLSADQKKQIKEMICKP